MKSKKYTLLFLITFFSISIYAQEKNNTGNNSEVWIEDQEASKKWKEDDAEFRELDKQFKEMIDNFTKFYRDLWNSGFNKSDGGFSKEGLQKFIAGAEQFKNKINNNSEMIRLNNRLNELAKVTSRSPQDRIAQYVPHKTKSINSDISSAKEYLKQIETDESKKESSLSFGNTSTSSSNTTSNQNAAYSRNRLSPEQRQIQAINQFSNDLRQTSNQFLAYMAQNSRQNYERKEQERLNKLEEKRIENERIAEEKRIEQERRIAEEKRLNELKNKPEYVNFLDNALNDVFYFDASGKEVDQKNATLEQVYIKQENGFYVAKYFNLKESYLAYDISYEIIPNPFIESLKTGPSIKYTVLNTKEEINYYYRNKLKQKTLNFWWRKTMHFEFYNYKDENVFGSGEILKPEIMSVSSSGAITNMEYKINSKSGKFKNHRFNFDYKGNIESLYIINEKGKIEERYKFSKY